MTIPIACIKFWDLSFVQLHKIHIFLTFPLHKLPPLGSAIIFKQLTENAASYAIAEAQVDPRSVKIRVLHGKWLRDPLFEMQRLVPKPKKNTQIQMAVLQFLYKPYQAISIQ